MGRRGGQSAETAAWIDQELAGCAFADVRLGKRFKSLVARLAEGVGESIPMACQDWAGTKAAYRFFANDRVSEAEILAGHFQATRDRFQATPGMVLVLHDTTELFLPAGAQAGDRSDLSAVWWKKRPGRSAPASHRVWDPLAFQPGRDPGGAAAGDRGGESVDPEEVQGL